MTVILCAEFKIGLVLARNRSSTETLAFLAASWAARRRATRCSGVSFPARGEYAGGIVLFGVADVGPVPPSPG